MANVYTTTTTVSNVVKAAYDRYLEFGLRSMPIFRQIVDKRPVQQAMPGSSVVFSFWADLAASTTPLTEDVDPDAVSLANPTTVSVTLNEYGNASLVTHKLEATSFSDVDPVAANAMAFNCADSVDTLVQNALAAGTNTFTVSGTNNATVTASPTVTTITTSQLMSSWGVRWAGVQLRSNNVVPRRGNLYACVAHPKVTVDLRQETGAGGWRDPHVYSAPDALWNGEVGQYEGFFFVESPRCQSAQSGSGAGGTQTRVFNSYFLGAQALAEAVGYEPQIVVGPVTDKLMRHRPIGWKALLGHSVYRQAAVYRGLTSSSIQPQA